MLDSTKQRYLKLAKHFYRTQLNNEGLSTGRIRSALIQAAPNYRPDYFRVVKNALAFDVRERGYPAVAEKILKIQNPTTRPNSTHPVKAKRPATKALNQEDFRKLSERLARTGKHDAFAAVILAWYLGARPSEMYSIRVEGTQFHITGAKQDEKGIRGADRTLVFSDEDTADLVANAVFVYQNTYRSLAAVRNSLREQCRQLWPQRKVQLTLKSLRHQLGSNLKASGLDPKVMAYIMGHQSTRSIERYGDKRLAHNGSLSIPAPAPDADTSKVRVHSASKPAWHSAVTAALNERTRVPNHQTKQRQA
ncbi:hypothetical protein LCGC14_0530750 [marine sediment metagenome]|uniref:Tyr recombinase domain-containing protein n=1 Tax=marine sediment metagenome TaxID=412755 RepID=A0A0F9RVV1_9ZZZZ|nr:site-specific integrase [Halopseudomonas sabulinigri]